METLTDRIRFIWFIVISVALIIVVRFFYLQIIQGDYYQSLSLKNKTRYVRINPQRGMLMSEDGLVLAGRSMGYQLEVFREEAYSLQRSVNLLSKIFPRRRDEIARRNRQSHWVSRFKPLPLMNNLSQDELARVEAIRFYYPELHVKETLSRSYPFESLFCHAVGYVSDADMQQLEQDRSLVPGDQVGQTGIEKQYDRHLRGSGGEWLVQVDAAEKEINRYLRVPDIPGQNFQLSLSVRLQKRALELMAESTGSVVMITMDGSILVYLSMPVFDSSMFLGGFTQNEWNLLLADPNKPLLDRNIQGLYPPGSLIKPFITMMALSEGAVTRDTSVPCSGGMTLGGNVYRCWNRSGHGIMNTENAIVESCDTYFYQLARTVGIQTLSFWLRKCGLGKITGIDLPTEKYGLVPDETWSWEVRNTPWFPGETISVGIGQGPILVTPLQMAVLYAGLAQGGRVPVPHIRSRPFEQGFVFPASSESIQTVRDALDRVVSSPRGTAHLINGQPSVSGKTGTAQVMKEVEGEPYTREHSWFAGYAPSDDPKVAICVLIEHGGHGSEMAAPIAAELLRAYLESGL